MHPLNFIIPYSYWPGPVNTIWGIEVGKYRLRVGDGRGKYKLDSGPGTRTKAGGQETHAPVKVSRHKSCSIYKLLPVYKHTKNCLITRVSPGLIFGVSWYRIFRKKKSSIEKMSYFYVLFEKDYLPLSAWRKKSNFLKKKYYDSP